MSNFINQKKIIIKKQITETFSKSPQFFQKTCLFLYSCIVFVIVFTIGTAQLFIGIDTVYSNAGKAMCKWSEDFLNNKNNIQETKKEPWLFFLKLIAKIILFIKKEFTFTL